MYLIFVIHNVGSPTHFIAGLRPLHGVGEPMVLFWLFRMFARGSQVFSLSPYGAGEEGDQGIFFSFFFTFSCYLP